MKVTFCLKIGECKVPVNGNLEHAPVCSGLEISVNTEIAPEEFSAYSEVVKTQVAAIAAMVNKQPLDLP